MAGSVRLLCGALGSGKTTYAIREIVSLAAVERSRVFVTNIDVKPPLKELLGRRLICLEYSQVPRFYAHCPRGSCIYLDEGTIHFDARQAMRRSRSESDELTAYLTHARKFGDDLTIIAHAFEHIDKRVRDFVSLYCWLTSTRRILRSLGCPGADRIPEFFIVRDYLDEECLQHVHSHLVRSSSSLWQYFDSYAVTTAGALERLAAIDVAESEWESGSPARGSFRWRTAALVAVVTALGVGVLV